MKNEDIKADIAKIESNIERLKREKESIYKSVQDMTVSANKTEMAIEQMRNIDHLIRMEQKKVTNLNAKLTKYQNSYKYDPANRFQGRS